MNAPSIVWFRDDLRVSDNPALTAALSQRASVIALYIFDEESTGIRPLGGATKWWLHESLLALKDSLSLLGIQLVLRKGKAKDVLLKVVKESQAAAVFWNRRYGAAEIAVDTEIKQQLQLANLHAESFQASLLFEPWKIKTNQGTPYAVFTPFWRACQNHEVTPRAPLEAPAQYQKGAQCQKTTQYQQPAPQIYAEELMSWSLQPSKPDWAAGLRSTWHPGEAAAQKRLQEFLEFNLKNYAEQRDFPAAQITSALSPHIRWGEISVQQIWHAVQQLRPRLSQAANLSATKFLTEIGWREFAWHTLYHFPKLNEENWRQEFDRFPWVKDHAAELEAWQQGQTGYPLVDAGMRELWLTGTMHNRVRMVTASFLTKNLLLDWRLGEQWFWDTLVDADAASNPFNWQWVAGAGVDAAPYFRIFNPELQAKKFDAQQSYIKQYVPEFGSPHYVAAIVDLANSRHTALAAYKELK